METGKLNQKVTIYSKTKATDAYGSDTSSWASYWATNAHVDVMKSSRTLEANQSQLKTAIRFTVRTRDDKNVYNDMMVLYRDQWYVIQNYVPDPVYKMFSSFDGLLSDNFTI